MQPDDILGQLKVLVVDDTAGNRVMLQAFLHKLGCAVVVAEDGAQAVEAFQREAPDLILMDAMMPVMDGYEATRRIKALASGRWVPVIFLSALDKDENLVEGLDAGGDDYLAKPINLVVLNAKLRSFARTLALQQRLREHAEMLQRYHDDREVESGLATEIMHRQLQRRGLRDPQFHYWLAPASDFSGDVVAACRSPQGRLYAMLADGTGHGLAAAISLLPVLTTFYGMAEHDVSLAYLATEMNRQLLAFMPTGRFVAAGLVRLSAEGDVAELWIGGMPEVMLVEANGAIRYGLAPSNLPLGITNFDTDASRIHRVHCPPGSQLVMHSDGLADATDGRGEPFGSARLAELLSATPPGQRMEVVKAAVIGHTAGAPAHDDMSMLLIDC